MCTSCDVDKKTEYETISFVVNYLLLFALKRRQILLIFQRFLWHKRTEGCFASSATFSKPSHVYKFRFFHCCSNAGSTSLVSIWSTVTPEIEHFLYQRSWAIAITGDHWLAARCFHKIADNRSRLTAIMWKQALVRHYFMVSIQQILWKLHSIAYVDTTRRQKPLLSNTF